MGAYAPRFKPGQDITYTASVDVAAGQVVEVTGVRSVGPAAAGSLKVVGVALFDAAAGELVTVQRQGVQRLVASGAVTAGDRVAAAANGQVATATTATIGTAIATAASGVPVDILFTV